MKAQNIMEEIRNKGKLDLEAIWYKSPMKISIFKMIFLNKEKLMLLVVIVLRY